MPSLNDVADEIKMALAAYPHQGAERIAYEYDMRQLAIAVLSDAARFSPSIDSSDFLAHCGL